MRTDPSLGVAHGCFWKYHPARAYAWELRLQHEICPDFTIDEPDAPEHRARFLEEHPEQAAELRDKELGRRERAAKKREQESDESETEDRSDDESESVEA